MKFTEACWADPVNMIKVQYSASSSLELILLGKPCHTIVSREAIGVDILCPCLQLLVVYNILVCLVELVDDVACIPLQSIPLYF